MYALLALALLSAEPAASTCDVYIGTYTRTGASKGIYRMSLELRSGRLGEPVVAAETTNPSFLAFHPTKPLLYAVGELPSAPGRKGGAVTAFRIHADGGLQMLNQVSSVGPGPCHVAVDPAGKAVLVANYGGGSVAALPIGPDGKLAEAVSFVQHEGSSVDPKRQKGPHAHNVAFDKPGRFAFVSDLGLDKVMIYRFDPASGKIAAARPPAASVAAGAGPRHFGFHPNGQFGYVINELNSTLTAFAYDGRGGLKTLGAVGTLPVDWKGTNYPAEVKVHPSGKFVYGSNRGHDSIAVFAVGADGGLKPVGHVASGGKTPRNFNIAPGGEWLLAAHQETGNVAVFRIGADGMPRPTGQSVAVPMSVCVVFRFRDGGQ